jgi:hypothetical protein
MAKKYALMFLVAVLVVVAVNYSLTDSRSSLTFAHNSQDGVVDKTQGGAFTVKITFKNTGQTEGNWSVNIAFEGDFWSQVGTAQNLALKSGNSKTLVWNGVVPANATIGSVARLVVYYSDGSIDSFKALNWWIHVVPGAELSITSSTVE